MKHCYRFKFMRAYQALVSNVALASIEYKSSIEATFEGHGMMPSNNHVTIMTCGLN